MSKTAVICIMGSVPVIQATKVDRAAMLLTACEKGLVDGVADVAPAGQAANSVLQVRTRSGGSAGEEATVAYPVTVHIESYLYGKRYD